MTAFNDKGTFTIWALGLCLTLFLICGIAIDLFRAFEARQKLNQIADISARAGASEIDVRQRQLYSKVVLDKNKSKLTVEESINNNAQINNINIEYLNIDIDPDQNEVSIEIHSNFSFFLLKMLPGSNDQTIISRASAKPFQG
ncbi:MAG: Tad domain-containing protein [Acidimicrobiia bacterium]